MTALADGVLGGDRAAIARAITLVESRRADHREQAQQLLAGLLPHAGKAQRVGITGVPGVGKSTFIDTLGMNLIAAGHRIAVLAVDPSSSLSGGSILADRTRMARLAAAPDAFVRASPSAGTLGGVAKATRESMLVMEAAGYDIVLVETVGVGQSEYVVADMVDTFLFLTLARTGDQLQGMKRGILELADVIGVNKADGEHLADSERAARELSGALRLLRGADDEWQTPVVTCSGRENLNLDRVWKHVTRHRDRLVERGELDAKRRRQLVEWTRAMVRDRLLERLTAPGVRQAVRAAEAAVLAGEITADQAARRIGAAVDAPSHPRAGLGSVPQVDLAGLPPAPAVMGERVALEPLRVEHAEEMAPLLDDAALHTHTGGAPATHAELRGRYAEQVVGHSADRSQRWLNWVIRSRADGAPLGYVQATVSEQDSRLSADVAWVVAVSQQGQGYAREAAALMVGWLRDQGVRVVTAHVHPDHHASASVARWIGLDPTGTHVDGEVRWQG